MKTIICAVFSLFLTATINAQGWYWQAPKPVGASLHTTSAAGNIFYAAGDAGTVVKSTNSGINWMHIPTTGTTNSIKLISHNVEDFVYMIDDMNNFYSSSTGGATWTVSPSQFTDVKKILMKSINTHYILTNNKLWRTTNGGVNFVNVAPLDVIDYKDFDFINSSTGYILISNNVNSSVWKTTNFGLNWTVRTVPGNSHNAVDFFDSENGYVGGEDGALRKTTNGGLEWSVVSLSNVNDVSAIQMYSQNEGYFICKDNSLWGVGWNNAFRINDFNGLTSLSASGQNVSITGYSGKICIRENGWFRQVYNNSNKTFYRVNFHNANTGFMAGAGGTISKSIDGGNTWVESVISPNVIFYGMDFINSTTGFVCGERGNIYRTTNAGQTWQLRHENTVYWLNAVNMINNTTGFAVGYNGNILMTTNTGGLWLEDVIAPGEQFFDIEFINNNTGFTCSNKLYKSTDGGLSWVFTNFSIPIGFHDINFLNENTGFIVGQSDANSGGKIYKTVNGGNDWVEKFSGEEPFYQVKFYSEQIGFATAGRGCIYKTVNGGESWNRVFRNGLMGEEGLINHNIMYRDLSFRTESEIYFTGSYGNILITDNGGSVNITPLTTASVPTDFSLGQNYPNPFNPETKIRFDLAKTGMVRLSIFDITGREIKTILNETKNAGSYEVSFFGGDLPSGVYFYKLNTGNFSKTKRMVLLK